MLPKKWTEVYLGNIITYKKGFAFDSSTYKDKGIRIIRISDTTRNSIHSNNPVYIAEGATIGLDQYILEKNDIILSTVGSRPHLLDSMVGKAIKIPFFAEGSLLNQNLVKLIPLTSKVTNEYLYKILKEDKFVCFISTLVRGNANQVSISLNELFKYKLLLPPLAEQKKIAQILSTWDKAITITEQLFANGQQQKKSLMQQLLTGKKRLLDENGVRFVNKWEHCTLKNIAQLSKGTQINKKNLSKEGNYPVINGGISPSGYTPEYNMKKNTITISEGGNSCGHVALQVSNFWCGGHCYALEKPNINFIFLYQALKLHQPIIMKLRVGSGLPNIQKKALESVIIKYPIDSKEQNKIAAVLSSADKEITILQQKLDMLKQEKKALMQQLLTGKRRVKVEEAA